MAKNPSNMDLKKIVRNEIQVPATKTTRIIILCLRTKWKRHAYRNSSSPSRDKASRMLRQAVARSAMDCHSSSVESVVSERTERKRSRLFIIIYLCLKQGEAIESKLSFALTLFHKQKGQYEGQHQFEDNACKYTIYNNITQQRGCILSRSRSTVTESHHWGVLLCQCRSDSGAEAQAGSVMIYVCRLHWIMFLTF